MSANAQDKPIATPVLVYDGRIGELYRIFLINILLTIVTLGIWRFWGETRMRRYVWSRTSSFGQRFEYDGTGGQLFVGFMLAVLLFVSLFGATTLVAYLLVLVFPDVGESLAIIPGILFMITVVTLALGAPLAAQRHRLSHTTWGSIRGGVKGSMLSYGLRSLSYVILTIVTAYQMGPWAKMRMYERMTNATFFGNQHFSASTRARDIYVRFLMAFVGILALVGAVYGTLYFLTQPVIALMIQAKDDPQATRQAILFLVPGLIVGSLIVSFGSALIGATFVAAYFRHIAGHTRFGALQFSSQITGMAVLRFMLGNLAILVFTLGIGIPVVIHRNLRFVTKNFLGSGTPDFASLQQSDQKISRFGEGISQVLDAGLAIV